MWTISVCSTKFEAMRNNNIRFIFFIFRGLAIYFRPADIIYFYRAEFISEPVKMRIINITKHSSITQAIANIPAERIYPGKSLEEIETEFLDSYDFEIQKYYGVVKFELEKLR